MGGTTGADPVASTIQRAFTRTPPPSSSLGPANRAGASTTRTPSPSKRSTLSCGAMAAMTPWTWRRKAAASTLGASGVMPKRPALRNADAAWAAAMVALDGTQP